MSGHSKWAQIKRKKALVDAKKGAIFSKIAKEITVAARLGGPDPAGNFRLRFAIDKAKANLVPQNNIQRAIEKGAGINHEDYKIEEIFYEGYGPNGIAILIQCATDNKNRTVADLRSCFTKHSGKLADAGTVSWMFTKHGEIKVPKDTVNNHDEAFEFAIEIGAKDIDLLDKECISIITSPEELEKVQKNILAKNIKIKEVQVSYTPKEYIEVTDTETAKNILKLVEEIEGHDDVQNVYSNFDIKLDIASMPKD